MTNNSKVLFDGPLKALHKKLVDGDIIEVRGHKTVELVNDTTIFCGKGDGIIDINKDFSTSEKYVHHEKIWYDSQSPNNEYIKEYASIWSTSSDDKGMTNSNYGFLLYSPQNGNQYLNVVKELKRDPFSRRAVAYYTNPFMHYVGGNDHVCTMYVSYIIRDNRVHAVVSMRSNDIRFGLIGADLDWQITILNRLAADLDIEVGNVHWHAVSLHLYERHFDKLLKLYKDIK